MQNRSNELPSIEKALASLRPTYWSVGLVSLVINLLMLTGPLFMLQVYDRVLASGSIPTLVVIALFAFVLYVFYGLLETLRGRILSRLGLRIDAQISAETYQLSTRLPLILGAKATKLRPLQDLDSVRTFLSGPGPAALFDIPWMPVYIGLIFVFHPVLGFAALGGAVVICLLIGLKEIFTRKPQSEFAAENNSRAQFSEVSRRNAEVIQAMGMMKALKANWAERNAEYLNKQMSSSDRVGAFSTLVKSFRFLLQSAVLGLGAWLAISQEITPGVMIAASILTSRALAPVEQAVGFWPGFVSARQAKARLQELLSHSNEGEKILELPLPSNSLTVDGASCGPTGTKHPYVQGVSFNLQSGQGMGIIGPSGSGKSTLARAIIGIVPALKGSVRFDGSEIGHYSPDRIGEFIGYLPQDVQLFEGSVAQNISRFSENASDEMVIKAAQLAGVHDLITALPDGFNTIIGPSGYMLSAGQQQRIALARALYGEPFLVVLDEPNSNLDADGESALTNAIKSLREAGSIVIVIAHRPSAIAALDQILCMKDGRQAAFGPKDEILQKVIAPVSNSNVG